MICYIVFCAFPRNCLRNGQGVLSPVGGVMNVLFESTQAFGFLCVRKSIEWNWARHTATCVLKELPTALAIDLVRSDQHPWMANFGFRPNDRYRYRYIWLK